MLAKSACGLCTIGHHHRQKDQCLVTVRIVDNGQWLSRQVNRED